MAQKFKHPKALRDYWAKIQRELPRSSFAPCPIVLLPCHLLASCQEFANPDRITKFAKKLTEKIVEEQPSTQGALAKLVGNFTNPFYAFNGITKEQFVSCFPLTELLRQSRIPRQSFTPTRQRPTAKRRAISKKIRLLILERDGYRCCLCGRTAKETKLEVDHKIPLAKGGTDSLNNLWTLCIDCNRGKSDLSI